MREREREGENEERVVHNWDSYFKKVSLCVEAL